MHQPLATIVRGDVLMCGASLFLAARPMTGDYGPVLLRISPNSGMRHRADVIPDHWADIAEAGLPMQDIVIRAGATVRTKPGQRFTPIGRVSKKLMARVDQAMRRESEAQRFEATPPVRSTLTAFEVAGDRGRKIGRQNAT